MRFVLASGLLFALACSSPLIAQDAKPEADADRSAMEQQFAESLSDAVLEGSFTILGRNDANPPKPERYEIGKVQKVPGVADQWVIVARIEYGGKDKTLPIPIPVTVKWAGDTPTIVLDDLTIPGMGTFDARVMFHKGRYAGTWQHGKAGGHLWGTYSQPEAAAEQASDPAPES